MNLTLSIILVWSPKRSTKTRSHRDTSKQRSNCIFYYTYNILSFSQSQLFPWRKKIIFFVSNRECPVALVLWPTTWPKNTVKTTVWLKRSLVSEELHFRFLSFPLLCFANEPEQKLLFTQSIQVFDEWKIVAKRKDFLCRRSIKMSSCATKV